MFSFFFYTEMILTTVFFCAAACPFLLPALLFLLLFRRNKVAGLFRFFICQYGRVMVHFCLRPAAPVRYEDRSGVPPGPCILILNHRSASDPFLIAAIRFSAPPAQAVNGWPMRLPFFGFFARLANYIDITKISYEEALEKTRRLLKEGATLCVFPEGTRSGGSKINPFHSTFFKIAKELNCPLHPVAIIGNEKTPDLTFRMARSPLILIRKLPPLPPDYLKDHCAHKIKTLARSILQVETLNMEKETAHAAAS